MTSWRGSQGAELEAAAHSDVPIANSMGSMGTAVQLPGFTLTVKDLGRGNAVTHNGQCFLPPLTSSREPPTGWLRSLCPK